MEERVECAVVTQCENKEMRLLRPFSIFNAEAEAINIQILSVLLSCLTVLDGMRKMYNPKVVR
jgi:hypothetical protein